MTQTPAVFADPTIKPAGGGLQGYVTASYAAIVKLLGPPNSPFIDEFKVDVEWLVQTPAGPATIYNWKPELPTGIAVEKITDWHVGGESRDVVQHVADALATVQHAPSHSESCGMQEGIPQQHNKIDLDAFTEHLLNGHPLFVPGGQPDHGDGTRNTPFSFLPTKPIELANHPLNPDQTPVVGGRLREWGQDGPKTWYVALAHLAHARGTCELCDPVWQKADDAWDEIPEYDDAAHAALFAAFGVGSDEALLVHIDDVPPNLAEPRVCRVCGCTDVAACETAFGPCAWRETYDDNTGICTACPEPAVRKT